MIRTASPFQSEPENAPIITIDTMICDTAALAAIDDEQSIKLRV
jgi:hypothetical protein